MITWNRRKLQKMLKIKTVLGWVVALATAILAAIDKMTTM